MPSFMMLLSTRRRPDVGLLAELLALASVTSRTIDPFRASLNLIVTVAPLPSLISSPDRSLTQVWRGRPAGSDDRHNGSSDARLL